MAPVAVATVRAGLVGETDPVRGVAVACVLPWSSGRAPRTLVMIARSSCVLVAPVYSPLDHWETGLTFPDWVVESGGRKRCQHTRKGTAVLTNCTQLSLSSHAIARLGQQLTQRR